MLKIPNLPIKQQKFHFRDLISFSENRIVNLKKRLYAQQFSNISRIVIYVINLKSIIRCKLILVKKIKEIKNLKDCDKLQSWIYQITRNAIIDYLTHKDRPWAVIVVSGSDSWRTNCTQIIQLDKGEIKNIKF